MESDFIIGIYNYREGLEVGYYITHLFGSSDLLELASVDDVLTEVLLRKVSRKDDGMIGPFENLSEMNQFAFGMCEKSQADWVGMISVKEYNQVLDCTKTLDDYKSVLMSKVNVMENIGKKDSSRNIIKRIFK